MSAKLGLRIIALVIVVAAAWLAEISMGDKLATRERYGVYIAFTAVFFAGQVQHKAKVGRR